jgi:myo-inositol 2-dehydrogenase/D-chiro-inositol 1-dehydrogenase
MSRYAEAYKNETIAFCQTLQEGKAPSPSGHDGKMALVLAMACDKSFKEKRPVK